MTAAPNVRPTSTGAAPFDRDRQHVLAVDLGTGGPKVGLVSLAGRIAWAEHHAVETRFGDGGAAEQDAQLWWRIIVDAARRGLASGVVDPASVVAVSCTGQWASTVPVDGAGTPVGPCVLWMDTRGGRYAKELIGGPVSGYDPRLLYTWVKRSGGVPSTNGADPFGQALWLRAERPEIWAAARWLLEPVDYLTMRFTGTAAATAASMTASWLVDIRDLDHCGYDPELVRIATADPAKLPPLRRTGTVIGVVQPAVAEVLGLSPGVQVVTGTPDLHSATFGSGAVADFAAHVAISTTSWISAHVGAKKTDPIRQIAAVSGAVAGRYLIANNHDTSGLCLQWLRDNVLAADDELGSTPVPDFATLDRLAATSPPGSGKVIFTPWLAGERSPVDDRNARGGFHNVSLATTRADLVRAVLEGVAYNNKWLLEAVESFAKQPLDPLRFIGGGSASALWCQIHADALERTVEQVAEPLHAGLRGAALFASVAIGAVGLHEVRELVPVTATFHPDAANRALYRKLYAELPRLYKAQKRMFARLNGR